MADACASKKDLYLPEPATIVAKRALTATEMMFQVRLDSGRPLGHMPGQFVELSVPGVGEAPISLSSSPAPSSFGRETPEFEIVVRRIGRVTGALLDSMPGAKLGIRGPFGTPFPVDGAMRGKDICFIAGGIGLAPLRSAILYVLDRRADYGNVSILYGTKAPAERLFADELAVWAGRKDVKLLETVDHVDAQWNGNVGVITTLIPKVGIVPSRAVVAACGPPIMYKFVLISLNEIGVSEADIFLSLERQMKCGIGKCGHCQINGLYACLEGPVFRYSQIAQMQEAI